MSAPAAHPSNALSIGSDKVWFVDGSVIILAAHEMDWEVRGFSRAAIYFRDKKYFLIDEERQKRGRVRYKLAPWPDTLHDLPSSNVTYDEAYVQQREQDCRKAGHIGIARTLAFPFYPLLGFFSSGFKAVILDELGFNAASITKASLFLQFFLILGL